MIIDVEKQPRIRIKSGWDQAGRQGVTLGPVITVYGVEWVSVLWDEDDDPDWQKASSLEQLVEKWDELRIQL